MKKNAEDEKNDEEEKDEEVEKNEEAPKKEPKNGHETKAKKRSHKSEAKEKDEEKPADSYLDVSDKDVQLQALLFEAYKFGARTGGSRHPKRPVTKKESHSNKKQKTEGTKEKKKKASSGLTKMTILSPALGDFLGETQLPRTEVVKRLHAYVKEKNLQNPKDGRKIIFDEKLQAVFKCKTTDFFKMNRLLSKHVKAPEEMV